jgi:hypothetical protein
MVNGEWEKMKKQTYDLEEREIVIQSSTSESSLTWFFSFDVERSMFDVRRSSLKTTHLTGPGSTPQ